MRKLILFTFVLIAAQVSAAIKVTFPDSFADGWEPYIGQTVEFTHPLYVCETTTTRSFSPPSDSMSQKSTPLDLRKEIAPPIGRSNKITAARC